MDSTRATIPFPLPLPLSMESRGLAVSTHESMSNGAAMFIGAVPDEWILYSDRAEDYTIGPPIGFGASSIVYAATYHGSNLNTDLTKSKGVPCALKVLDLDSLPVRALQLLQRETTLMSLSKHPNVLRVRGSWVDGHKLYIALRLMNKGSAADVMHYGWPGGMEEDVVRCILRQSLKGLNYLHTNGFIHRDVKAANLLIDDDGTVLLGDLGVAADLTEDSSHVPSPATSRNLYSMTATNSLPTSASAPAVALTNNSKHNDKPIPKIPQIGKRKSFVGTPCWMAPELIQGKQYDSKADIWSFGITALELTQGRPPRSKESPHKVLLRTVQEDPPTLNRDGGGVHKYSRAFKEVIDSCLVKDPAKRPTAEELLQTPFFRGAKKKSYLINTILSHLPPLTQRQERRAVPPALSANSIDSWDFGVSVNSPTTSIYRRRVLEDLVLAEELQEQQQQNSNLPFEMDEDCSRRLEAVSQPLADDDDDSSIFETENNETGQEAVSSSYSSVVSTGRATSHASSQLLSNTESAPSSYTSSILELSKAESNAVVSPNDENRPSLSPVVPEQYAQNTLIDTKPVPPTQATPVRAAAKNTDFISTKTPTLWSKLKPNTKRHEDRDRANSLPSGKDKEKGKLNGMFSIAGKGILSRGSSRSLATPSKATS
ncbi:kinase-like protein [Pholiota conissans]|uniref:Kinase-like protein n=1 Tax=Pholiota conissans TaxID=109636 RepID=A0A9P6D241_9AGAR|nr:kinase-like protein [Pholiota conissans]